MADISGLILTVLGLSFELASTIYSYSKDVKGASRDIQQLSNELFALIGVIEHIKMQREQQAKSLVTNDGGSLSRVLNETIEFLQELQTSLATPKSRFQAVAQKLKWPLQEKETKGHLLRLERVKSYFVLSQVTEEIDMSRHIASQISELSTQVRQSTLDQEEQRSTGAGKTFLMTTAVDKLAAEQAGIPIVYYYCSFANAESLRSENILGSILAQLCASDSAMIETLTDRLSRNRGASTGAGKPRHLEEQELVDLITQYLSSRESLYLLIDGVNECEDPQSILQWIANIVTSCSNCSIHLFISSINEKDIEMSMEGLPDVTTENLRQIDIRNDVRSLVLASLESDPRLRRHSPELKGEIERALTKGAMGMFRWVQCQLDSLAKLRTPGAVKKALDNLPPTLDKTYESLLDRIEGEEDRNLAREILEVLCFSFRPFTINEVHEILQVTPGIRYLDDSKCLADPKDVLSICGSLLNFQQNTGRVSLAHHSVKTYLTSDLQGRARFFQLSEEEADRTIATKCLTYLSFDAFSDGPCRLMSAVRERYRQHHLLDYAAQRWTQHARNLDELGDTLWGAMKDLLLSQDHGRGNFSAWVQMLLPAAKLETISRSPPLYYAASYGLTTVVKYLIEAGVDLEVHAGRCGATPLNIASFRGHYDVVKLLLEHGADPEAVDDSPGWSAAQWARYNRHYDVYELLQEHVTGDQAPFDRQEALIELRNRLQRPVESGVIVAAVNRKPDWPWRLWWTLVGLAESAAAHPFGIAICQAAKSQLQIDVSEAIDGNVLFVEDISGQGVRAHIEIGGTDPRRCYIVTIGIRALLITQGIDVSETLEIDKTFRAAEDLKKPMFRDYAHVYVAIDKVFAGRISLDNPVTHGTIRSPDSGMEIEQVKVPLPLNP